MANDNTRISSTTKDDLFCAAFTYAVSRDMGHWAHVYSSQTLSQTAAELSQLGSCDDGSVDASDALCELL